MSKIKSFVVGASVAAFAFVVTAVPQLYAASTTTINEMIDQNTDNFIDALILYVTNNLDKVLILAAGIIVWFVLKKWVFGSGRRI